MLSRGAEAADAKIRQLTENIQKSIKIHKKKLWMQIKNMQMFPICQNDDLPKRRAVMLTKPQNGSDPPLKNELTRAIQIAFQMMTIRLSILGYYWIVLFLRARQDQQGAVLVFTC